MQKECNSKMKKIAVIGGDLRIVKLVEMLAKDGYEYLHMV